MVHPLPVGALASVGGAWVLAILATTTGKAALFHQDRLIMGGTPVAAAIGLFFLSWLVMVGAIVGPSILIAWSRSNGRSVSSNKLPALLGAYVSVWMAFGFLAFMGDFAVHHLVDHLSWVAARPWLISAGILVTAGAYQLTSFKYWCLRLSLPADEALSDGRTSASLKSGTRIGVLSIASWGPLMLLALAAGLGNLAWMFALALLVVLETSSSESWWWCRVSGMGLLALAGLVAVHPEWALLLFAAH
jgi:predicted metal-binding membrane protein